MNMPAPAIADYTAQPGGPVDIDAEQALLGSIFINNEVLTSISGMVKAEHFSEPLHQQIFRLCTEAHAAGKAVSPVSLHRFLPKHLDGLGISTSEYLARLATAGATTIVNAPDFAATVRDLWGLRQLWAMSTGALDAAADSAADPRILIAEQTAELDAVRAEIDERRRTRRPAGEFVTEAIDRLDRIRAGEAPNVGASSGLRDLDHDIGGLRGGNLVIIAGRPGMGKSVLGASIARQCAAAGHGVGLFSLEMHDEQISARLLADHVHDARDPVPFKAVIEGKGISDAQFGRIVAAEPAIRLLPLELDTSPALTVAEIGARARAMASALKKRDRTLQVLVVDYLKFVRASDRYKGQRVYEVGEITAGMKALAKDLDVCVVLLVQLNRQVEARSDKRPELADLRESGDIEADADVVLLLFREAYYLAAAAATDGEAAAKLMSCEHELEVIIAKNRNGPVRSVRLFCDVTASAVRNLARA